MSAARPITQHGSEFGGYFTTLLDASGVFFR